MGDTMRPRHRLHFLFFDAFGEACVLKDSWSQTTVIECAQLSEQYPLKVNKPDSFGLASESDPITHKSFADEAQLSLPADLSVAAHPTNCPAGRIFPTASWDPVFGRTAPILSAGCPLAQRLVRPLQIVIAAPTLQPALLRPWGARNRPGRFGLQLPVHLFVGAIVLRMCWSNKFHLDSQTGPPGTQARQARRPGRSKRPSIVHSNDLGHSIPSKKPDKHSFLLATISGRAKLVSPKDSG